MGGPFPSPVTTYKMFWDVLIFCSAPIIFGLKECIHSADSSPDFREVDILDIPLYTEILFKIAKRKNLDFCKEFNFRVSF